MPNEGAARRPVLVLVHGTRMSRAQWEPYRALLPDVDLVTVDLPGHGARVGEAFTREAALATIDAAVAQARDLAGDEDGGGPVLAGHSLGGYLAMMWAAGHTGALRGLVLIGATADPRGPLTGVYRGFARALPALGTDRTARVANALMRALGARGEHAAALPDGAAYAALPAAWDLVMSEVTPDLLRVVECPVVLVNGQLDQMRIHVRRFAAAARDAQVVTIPGASHLMPSTHPQQVAAVLREAVLGVHRAPRHTT
ncbi:putative hydrolase [Serinicoccus hydrothermalis]|uniref:Putative hydrolase n=1 Tax=Serinicoccus hydrothermalis TaxID=1758689 RepID=A0A1B1NFZ6_9MICO|nr:alpha/beta hydrolase [Serinicoccus hydrothermalis]ANS80345.1 putative hydrolase [Serinicoccus hydrothermalis]